MLLLGRGPFLLVGVLWGLGGFVAPILLGGILAGRAWLYFIVGSIGCIVFFIVGSVPVLRGLIGLARLNGSTISDRILIVLLLLLDQY